MEPDNDRRKPFGRLNDQLTDYHAYQRPGPHERVVWRGIGMIVITVACLAAAYVVALLCVPR